MSEVFAFASCHVSSVGKASACNAGDPGLIPGREDPLEEEMVTPSSILAWRIPWTEEPGGLQPMGSQESDTTERLNGKQQGQVDHVQVGACSRWDSAA